MQERTQQCIYCLRHLDRSAFDRDHVVPAAFTPAFQENLTLGVVCRECNHYFGTRIEAVFAHGSLEAVLRLHYGLVPPEEAEELIRRRVRFEYPEGEYAGLHIALTNQGGTLLFAPIPQVGFARRGGGWTYVIEEHLTSRQIPTDIEPSAGIRIIGLSREDEDRLVALLSGYGIPYARQRDLPRPERWGEVNPHLIFPLDGVVRRTVSKIAFNYLAYAAGDDLVVRSDFHGIRSYIREGAQPTYEPVRVTQIPVLRDDRVSGRRTPGHTVTVEWPDPTVGIVGQVALFNEMTYSVVLAPGVSGIWRPVRSGHFFDLRERRVSPLLGTHLVAG